MSELTSLTLAEARDRLRRREFSSVELADAHLVAMEKARELNAFVLETPEHARAMAAAAARIFSATIADLSMLELGIRAASRSPEIRADNAPLGKDLAMHSATLTITSSPTCMPKVSLITCSRSMSR